ncbi:Anaphase-promoting complex subunit 23 [Tulasnella sp. 419]|nr:Anaphase-promoting complex subunit 23 [Tulasnella sp. 419]
MDIHIPQIRRAVHDCSERGLYAAAKWAADFLLHIPPSERPPPSHLPSSSSTGFRTSTPTRNHGHQRPSLSFAVSDVDDSNMLTEDVLNVHDDIYALEEDFFLAGRESFNSKEFEKASHILKDCHGPKARFLRVYSAFLASEKEASDNWTYRRESRIQDEKPVNQKLPALLQLLHNVNNTSPELEKNEMDPFLLFLKGLILGTMKRRAEATECIILSLTAYPWNWSCWLQLSAMIEDPEEWSRLAKHLPQHPTTKMLALKILIEFNAPPETLDEYVNELTELFPYSLFIRSQKALLAYHHRDFAEAESIFESILAVDPYRIDNLDIYANILYVEQSRAKLSDLAQRYIRSDKDRPEVCGLIGNYYSLRCEHEKAVKYFRRAIQLDPTHLAAWTLMGHEYLEMKNPQAANEAYRRAIDLNRKDYRAWYGLGKTYELLDMVHYALHYYQRAAALRPYDSRMWLALAGCYRSLNKFKEAIECMKRAQMSADPSEISHFIAIATLYDKVGDMASAATHHRRCIEICRKQGRHLQEYAKSCIYVAEYEINLYTTNGPSSNADLKGARALLEEVSESNVEEVSLAADLLRKLRGLRT